MIIAKLFFFSCFFCKNQNYVWQKILNFIFIPSLNKKHLIFFILFKKLVFVVMYVKFTKYQAFYFNFVTVCDKRNTYQNKIRLFIITLHFIIFCCLFPFFWVDVKARKKSLLGKYVFHQITTKNHMSVNFDGP